MVAVFSFKLAGTKPVYQDQLIKQVESVAPAWLEQNTAVAPAFEY